jgi:hypothetical protein
MSDLRTFHSRPANAHLLRRIAGVVIVGLVVATGAAYVYESQPKPAQPPVVANDELPSPTAPPSHP